MKVRLLPVMLAIAFASIASDISAQTTAFRQEVQFGAYAGGNASMLYFAPNITQKMMIRSNVGVAARYISEKYFGIQAELGYSQRGWMRDFEGTKFDCYYNRTMEYLEFPLLTHITFGEKTQVFVNLGPKISLLLNEKEHTDYTPPTGEADEDKVQSSTSPDPEIHLATQNSFDWGIVGGIGLEFNTKAGSFLIEGRYYYGLGNIFNSTKRDPFAQSSFQNISLNVSYLIPNILTKTVK